MKRGFGYRDGADASSLPHNLVLFRSEEDGDTCGFGGCFGVDCSFFPLVTLNGSAHGKVLYYDNTFAPGTEPDGFDRIKWGTDIASLDPWQSMELTAKIGLSAYYKRKKADLKFGLARLDEIIYEFWDGKFAGAVVKTTGYSNYIFLKEYCFKRFGPGDRTEANARMDVQNFFWNGYATRMTLTYNERYRTGELRMVSIKMENQQKLMGALGTQEEVKGDIKKGEKSK